MFAPLLLTLTLAATPSPFNSPESAVQDPRTGTIYVSNVGGQPGAKDGNGYISKLDANGKVVQAHLFPASGDPALNGPTGLVLDGETLYVADIDRVVAFDLASGRQSRVVDLSPEHVAFANDLLLQGQQLYVSDTAGDQVLRIDLAHGDAVSTVLEGATGGANGLVIDPATGDLLVASSPADFKTPSVSWRVHTPDGKSFHLNSALPFPPGINDGIGVRDGAIYLSDWATGAIWRVEGHRRPTAVVNGLKGPADFAFTTDGKRLIVVEMLANAVTLHSL